MKFARDITELIGNTPLVRINRVAASRALVPAKKAYGLKHTAYGNFMIIIPVNFL
ncbi:MAG: hypothetical protein KKH28_02490 [Elusimicrobia bacterium]|nr:hypothetical protein [Elusimicrobiota bacterium]